MQRFASRAAIVVMLVVGAYVPALAQSPSAGLVHGVVLDRAGQPVQDALVVAVDGATGLARTARTTREGFFEIPFVLPGVYSVLVERVGFQPQRLVQVPVGAGARVKLPVTLAEAVPPFTSPATVRHAGERLPAGRTGFGDVALPGLTLDLPRQRLEAAEHLLFASSALPRHDLDGLPGRLAAHSIDGFSYRTAAHPGLPQVEQRSPLFPLTALHSAELVLNAAEVEVAGSGAGQFWLTSRPGERQFRARAYGNWADGMLGSSRFFDPGEAGGSTLEAGFVVAGPVIADTATLLLGVEAWTVQAPRPSPWLDRGAGDELAELALANLELDLRPYTSPHLLESRAISGFGRFDWQVGDGHHVSVRAGAATLPASGVEAGEARSASLGAGVEGTDLFAAAIVASKFRPWLSQELRVAAYGTAREYSPAGAAAALDALPGATLVSSGLSFGTEPGLPGRFRETSLALQHAVQYRWREHRLKAGWALNLAGYDYTYAYGDAGEIFFGGLDEFGEAVGVYAGVRGTIPGVTFSQPRRSLFLQTVWDAAPGLEITAGARQERDWLPVDDIRRNVDWLLLSGLDNRDVAGEWSSLAPRLAIRWDVHDDGRLVLNASAGRFADRPDPALLAEALSHDGRVRFVRVAGDLDEWHETLPVGEAEASPRLTLLGPDFGSPLTQRGKLGLSWRNGSAALHLGVTARQTERLPRRQDLNRPIRAVARDQYDRPIYGELVQQGELLAAVPGTNRRFGSFDMVSAITTDGRSDYRGVDAGLEYRFADVLELFGSYTFSRTEDDWPGAGAGSPESQLDPFPQRVNGRHWASGRSDLDVPHRLALGGELRLANVLDPSIAAVFRYRSGYPFTPGFRYGVDANGDGAAGNDPAFVDDELDGMAALIRSWSCLRHQVGRFAERNACRGPGVQALDLRLGLELLRGQRLGARLAVDVLNLLEPELAFPDRALYRIDPDGELEYDEATGRYTVPLIANPDFGRPLARYTSGRRLRIGLQVSF